MANCRRQMSEMRDLRQTLEDLRQEMEALRESSARAERKAAISANETEEARTLLEMAEKQKRQLEHELNHMRDSLNETVAQVGIPLFQQCFKKSYLFVFLSDQWFGHIQTSFGIGADCQSSGNRRNVLCYASC